jgi:HEAT repeat protein
VVRASAATAIGVIGDPGAIELLLAHEADPDPRAAAAVASALRRLGQEGEGGALRRTGIPWTPGWTHGPLLGDSREADAS